MIEEKALLLYNKFKRMKESYVRDNMNGQVYMIDKVKMVKRDDTDFKVLIFVKSDVDAQTKEIDSEYANVYFREIVS